MKNLRFQSCLLVSHKEKRARKVEFHPTATVLIGANDVGKSSIAKSLYHTLGAPPAIEPDGWKNANISSLLRFTIDGEEFEAFRSRSNYALFREGKLLGRYRSVTSGLAPALSELLGFTLKLPARDAGGVITPPTAYMFLPFYCDQDKGWSQTWSSFSNLQQFKDWKKEVIPYHAGFRSRDYYVALQELHEAAEAVKAPRFEANTLFDIRKRSESSEGIDLDIDPAAFKAEIDELVDRLNQTASIRAAHRQRLGELHQDKLKLAAQKEILDRVRRNLAADYKFVVEALPDDSVECPTCGQLHENDFEERFSIAQDEAKTADLFLEVSERLAEIVAQIGTEEARFASIGEEHAEIEKILAKKKGQVTFGDIVKRHGLKAVSGQIDQRLALLRAQVAELDLRIDEARRRMVAADAGARKKQAMGMYRDAIDSGLYKLGLGTVSEKVRTKLDAPLRETGSDLPRLVLAYMFAILKLVWAGANTPRCPIVIDSPNQQDQDEANHLRMLEFIRDQRPEGSQLILCVVSDCGVEFGGTVVELDNSKYSVLEKDAYEALAEEISVFETAAFAD